MSSLRLEQITLSSFQAQYGFKNKVIFYFYNNMCLNWLETEFGIIFYIKRTILYPFWNGHTYIIFSDTALQTAVLTFSKHMFWFDILIISSFHIAMILFSSTCYYCAWDLSFLFVTRVLFFFVIFLTSVSLLANVFLWNQINLFLFVSVASSVHLTLPMRSMLFLNQL